MIIHSRHPHTQLKKDNHNSEMKASKKYHNESKESIIKESNNNNHM